METLEKLDLQKAAPEYYSAKTTPSIVELKEIGYIAISGKGSPDHDHFLMSVQAIYGVGYKIKSFKKAEGRDFKVAKMEAFWWLDEGHDFEKTPKEGWNWEILIRMPDYINTEDLGLAKKSLITDAWIEKVEWHIEPAGKFAQILHLGSYSEETTSINKLLQHVKEKGLKITGQHKEIYLTDPRKTAQEKLKTILRYRIS
jgi:hypothetical protein